MVPLNCQPTEKPVHKRDGVLDVVRIWHSIQGEGPFAGVPAVFVRLAGCNLQCPDCDTDYTSTRSQVHPTRLVENVTEVRHKASQELGHAVRTRLIVLTGGEPFRQNLASAVRAVLEAGFRVQVETNGTLFPVDLSHGGYDDSFPWYGDVTVVCSPKTGQVNEQLRPHVHCLKYVVEDGRVDERDGLPTQVLGNQCLIARPWDGFRGEIILNPADQGDPELNRKNLQAAAKSCLKFGYRLGVQLHKLVGLD